MIVRLSMLVAFLFSLGAVSLRPDMAEAKQPPRVKGTYCRTLAASRPASKIWWSSFYGERTGLFNLETYHVSYCFKSEADCKAWLYWAQTDYPQMNRVQRCRRGLP